MKELRVYGVAKWKRTNIITFISFGESIWVYRRTAEVCSDAHNGVAEVVSQHYLWWSVWLQF